MFDAVQDGKLPLAAQVADRITSMITDQNLARGEQLPNEFELANYLNVGRGTVREAVKLLVSRNILEIHRGKGTFVNQHPGVIHDPCGFAFVQDKYQLALDLLEIRTILEPNVAELAALRATEEDIKEIRQLCMEVEGMIRSGIPHLDKDVELHSCIARSTQNKAIPNIIPIINYSIGMFVEMTKNSLNEETIETHRHIVDAIANHDGDLARSAMLQHLKCNQERMINLRVKIDK